MIIEVNDQNYEAIVKNSENPVVLDFYAEWCNPCKTFSTVLNEINSEYDSNLKILKIDVDNNPELTAKFQIRNLPTVLFMKNEEVIDKQVGAVNVSVFKNKINKFIN